MPTPRELMMARIKAAKNAKTTTSRANTASNLPVPVASASQKRRLPHKHGEKRTIFGAVVFIAVLVVAGVIYSGMSTGPPEKSEPQAALQIPAPTRIARILLPGKGPLCREILFDNDTGYFSLEKPVACDSNPSTQAKVGTGNNLGLGSGAGNAGFSSFKEAFGRKS